MPFKPVIQGLAAVWAVLFLVSFVSLRNTGSEDPDDTLARVAAFLTWQVIAFVVAVAAAGTARYAISRGVERVKLVGYTPLVLSVFLVASFVVLMGFRFYVVPRFE